MIRPLPRVTSITGPDGGPVDVRRCLNAILSGQRPPAYDLRGHGDLSSHMKAGDPCRWDEGQCGGTLKVAQ